MWSLHRLAARNKSQEELVPSTASSDVGVDRSVPSSAHADLVSDQPTLPEEPIAAHPDKLLTSPWDFTQDELSMFPALRRRNFWCIQRHQARALHYDLRMQLDGTTMSWAIPRGLLGISKLAERNRLAVETTLHPISYTTYEGGDGRILPSGERCGTLLWDIGTYTIDYPWKNDDSDSENEKRKRRKHARGEHEESDDTLGKHDEDKFRMAMNRPVRVGKSRSIHFTLKGGKKLDNHSYILIQSPQNSFANTFTSTGKPKVSWFISLPKGVQGYSWGQYGEEGTEYGRSVKTGRTLREVCAAQERITVFDSEKQSFADWAGDTTEIGPVGKSDKSIKRRRK